ncbi:hypothetical protein BJAS_P1729 [Bathymodiolus japonicus methanotrophic gill symbiont]|uniref:transposase n=1 Tax=Bathymodiolus japonicus methanotrophic gill symbiont TaxID=113269 RepID=UPI001B504630|nr:hypothetical protein BJAS_P1729 [Bathymodiolus japonicus methanotrophic gill symbiont]
MAFYFVSTFPNAQTPTKQRPYGYRGLKIITSLKLRFQDFQRMTGTYHSVSKNHLPRYLAEFCYRFIRRFQLEDMIPRLGYIAARTAPMPVKLLKVAEGYG